MKPIIFGLTAAALLASGGLSLAQTTQRTSPSNTTTAAVDPSTHANAASGDNNQAVATTNANASTPAKGANSFTLGEAKSRIEKSGFSNVGSLTKDDNGVWHGNAQKNGNTTTVWLDYKGNVGETR